MSPPALSSPKRKEFEMPRGPRRGSKKKPRLSRGFKMTFQRDPTHRHHSEPDNLRCALSALSRAQAGGHCPRHQAPAEVRPGEVRPAEVRPAKVRPDGLRARPFRARPC